MVRESEQVRAANADALRHKHNNPYPLKSRRWEEYNAAFISRRLKMIVERWEGWQHGT